MHNHFLMQRYMQDSYYKRVLVNLNKNEKKKRKKV